MKNKELWNSVCKTDPAAVKAITGKQYKGNSPRPYWIIERATEVFGPCGSGWGVVINDERFERLSETDVLHVANVTVWYLLDNKRCELQQMGQTKAVYKTSGGSLLVDEDAPKKSVTDAMVKCLSMIGFAGDIFSGRWDDSKYVESMRAEFAAPPSTIGEEGAANIIALLEDVGANKDSFMMWVEKAIGVDSLNKIPADKYDSVVGVIEKKRSR
jgi:hypothetical protein